MGKSIRKEDIKNEWVLVNAENRILGRLASNVAKILMGKHKPIYTPYLDTGDFVVIINASKVRLTGKKLENKIYYRHSQYPGGLKEIKAKTFFEKNPKGFVEKVIKGMLPKSKLGRQMFMKLKVYAGDKHRHSAQQPKEINI